MASSRYMGWCVTFISARLSNVPTPPSFPANLAFAFSLRLHCGALILRIHPPSVSPLTRADPQALVLYYQTADIPLRPQAGVLVASIIVSILGSYATLLVLGRRTSSRGWRNHLLLGVAALCFASVAVWGMHFVSMISVRLKPSPDVTWYIRVSSFPLPSTMTHVLFEGGLYKWKG